MDSLPARGPFRALHFALWVTGLKWPSRRPSRCTAPLQRGLEATNKAHERQTEYATDLPQLKQIEAAGPRFVVADESLRLPKFARHIHLAQPGLPPQFLKKSQERFLLFSIRSESRTTLLHSKGSIRAS